jgi:hypothetical protein
MGLIVNDLTRVNNEPTYAFDQQFAYRYFTDGWERLGTGATAIWTGSNSDFFWGETYRGALPDDDTLYVTNDKDYVRYYSTSVGNWADLRPIFNSATGGTIDRARIVINFKDRLLLMNIREVTGAVTKDYRFRLRYSQNGNPTAVDAFYENVPGKGNWLDLPTQEAIITAQHLRDRVIVFCERSTWELVYTNNQVLPFVWQQINTELGAESTFSQVPFDEVVLGVGNVGIHACDGMSVKRIDDLIPDDVFLIHNADDGVKRVAGIRDYVTEQVYWTVPSVNRESPYIFPDQILVFNYKDRTWATFDDSITAWGYIQEGNINTTWADLVAPMTWATWLDPWGSEDVEKNPQNRNILAGNQEGFVFIVDTKEALNAASLQITNMTTTPATQLTVINHNFKKNPQEPEYIFINDCQYDDASNGLNGSVFMVIDVVDSNTIDIGPIAPFTGNYVGGGTITRLSRVDILTKQYDFYLDKGMNVYISKVDFNVDRTAEGAITVDYFTSSTTLSMNNEAATTGASLGVPILETSPYALIPMEAMQAYLWHPFYVHAEGNFIQLRLYYSNDQMTEMPIHRSDFQLNAMAFYCLPITRLN